jgi:hypothetical protein
MNTTTKTGVPIPKPGETVDWPIRAQGVNRTGRGECIAVAMAGGPPKDIWPKDREKPSSRELHSFTKPREKPYCIVKEERKDGQTRYLTPALHTPVRVVPKKGEKKTSMRTRKADFLTMGQTLEKKAIETGDTKMAQRIRKTLDYVSAPKK